MGNKRRNLFLIGPMGSGKTAVGKQLARDLDMAFHDTDAEIERRTGVDIPFIFEKEGEAGFREREREVLARLAALDHVVVATGGGAVLSADNRAVLKENGLVIYLHASVDEQLKRTSRSQNRPLLKAADPRAVLDSLMAVRRPLYEETADISLDTTGRQVGAVADALRGLLADRGLAPLKK
ncbi:MAG TPA: shikimate kinase AroK [Gammaproteobacteria bacterium]|nr:shikimate kinase AroK [Gammaproteobacteria bacterium]